MRPSLGRIKRVSGDPDPAAGIDSQPILEGLKMCVELYHDAGGVWKLVSKTFENVESAMGYADADSEETFPEWQHHARFPAIVGGFGTETWIRGDWKIVRYI